MTFFGKEFPAGQVRVEVKSTAKPAAGAKVSFTDVNCSLYKIILILSFFLLGVQIEYCS